MSFRRTFGWIFIGKKHWPFFTTEAMSMCIIILYECIDKRFKFLADMEQNEKKKEGSGCKKKKD